MVTPKAKELLEETAHLTEHHNIKFGMIDHHQDTGETYMEGYPTLYLFSNSIPKRHIRIHIEIDLGEYYLTDKILELIEQPHNWLIEDYELLDTDL